MTTVAFDGVTMAADTLTINACGMRGRTLEKIWLNKFLLVGCAGDFDQIARWLMHLDIDTDIDSLIRDGYPLYDKDSNDPALLVVDRLTNRIYRHTSGSFVPSHHRYFAVGSGRHFAMAAMYMGKTAKEAVAVAAHFDINTGGDIIEIGVNE